jgi:glycosyltransferase involved in cell wall biosynthesis
MDYAPNISAAQRFAEAILPEIRRTHLAAQFHIVGRAPTPDVRALADDCTVRVWGEVPAVQPFVAAADCVVAPLTIARGVQNKVLEAMAMGRPVLLSPEAATGIPATDGLHFAVADGDSAFADAALRVLADRERASAMGYAARRFVIERMSWPAMLEPLPELVGRQKQREERLDAA